MIVLRYGLFDCFGQVIDIEDHRYGSVAHYRSGGVNVSFEFQTDEFFEHDSLNAEDVVDVECHCFATCFECDHCLVGRGGLATKDSDDRQEFVVSQDALASAGDCAEVFLFDSEDLSDSVQGYDIAILAELYEIAIDDLCAHSLWQAYSELGALSGLGCDCYVSTRLDYVSFDDIHADAAAGDVCYFFCSGDAGYEQHVCYLFL